MLEAVCVGAVLALVHAVMFRIWYPTTLPSVLTTGFVLGILIHLGFEVFGFNTYYCRHGAACGSDSRTNVK